MLVRPVGMDFKAKIKRLELPSWDVQYDAAALPQSSTPAWTQGTFSTGFTEEIISGQLHLVNGSGNAIYYSRSGVVTAGNVTAIKAKIKVVSEVTGMNIQMQIDDSSKRVWAEFFTDRVVINDNGSHTYMVDMTKYREVELRKYGTASWKLYVDGLPVLSGTDLAASSGNNRIFFGHGSSTYYGESYWDYLYYNLNVPAYNQ